VIAEAFHTALDQIFQNEPPADLGLAVSGGGDSVALMHLAARWAQGAQVRLHVVTIDHGLRGDSASEAATVAIWAGALNLPHDTLRWTGWDGRGNLQSAARTARRDLIGGWARDRGIDSVATGHTRNDQAETVLLRIARGSGVDGLAGMAGVSGKSPVWLRPLLRLSREDLRGWLRDNDISWFDDPSNDDPRFDRVRARQMQTHLSKLGLTPERLATLADHMGNAREVLRHDTQALATRIVVQDGGDLLFDRAGFESALNELQNRLLAAAVMWIASASYRPRYDALRRFGRNGVADTLAGCLLRHEGETIRLCREYNAVKDLRSPTSEPWDNRWILSGPHAPDLHVAALGPQGLQKCPGWRATGQPQPSLIVSPAVWRDDTLIAAPLAGLNGDWTAQLAKDRDDFTRFLLSH